MPRLLLALLMASLCHSLSAEVSTPDPLFASEDIIPITIAGPLTAIGRDRSVDPEYRPAELTVPGLDGVNRTVTIGLRPRGKSRRNPDACDFPPLRVDLPKEGLEGTVFAGQDELKLVTQCRKRDNSHRFEQYLLKEYLIYKMFNRLTDVSFRARLVQVTYVENPTKGAPATSYGFFIEDKDDLAKRHGATVAEVPVIPRESLEPVPTNRLEVFEFLIGNTDFSMLRGAEGDMCCHNTVPLLGKDGKISPVPYDFDSTGVVDPPYAMPVEALKINNVKDRIYRGKCDPIEVFNQTLTEFRDARADISAVFKRPPPLQERTIQTAIDYLDDFYAIIDDPKQLDRRILSVCRK